MSIVTDKFRFHILGLDIKPRMWNDGFMEYRLWRKYCRKYISLIKISNQTCENELMEKHHIFPQSIFGKNKRITTLTPRQHFIAHKLLLKIFYFRNGLNSSRYHKMQKAFCWMQTRHCVKYNSRRYEFCKKIEEWINAWSK